eukprot:TRINITY_DN77153_c0_g1_i1.p1 TRINITY_DN77153_c0_g1~~TRINITY_DN77153_c0_g1_i1.p1  ORF type:complete len:301 (+),score=63.17 TRINITY_DN77153_c0_g1_i1:65-967(+)
MPNGTRFAPARRPASVLARTIKKAFGSTRSASSGRGGRGRAPSSASRTRHISSERSSGRDAHDVTMGVPKGGLAPTAPRRDMSAHARGRGRGRGQVTGRPQPHRAGPSSRDRAPAPQAVKDDVADGDDDEDDDDDAGGDLCAFVRKGPAHGGDDESDDDEEMLGNASDGDADESEVGGGDIDDGEVSGTGDANGSEAADDAASAEGDVPDEDGGGVGVDAITGTADHDDGAGAHDDGLGPMRYRRTEEERSEELLRTVFLRGLPTDAASAAVNTALSRFGRVVRVLLVRDRATGLPSGSA